MPPDFWVWMLAVSAFVLMLGMGLSGCSRTVYVPVEAVRADTVYQSKAYADTTWLRDSIHVEIRTGTDTVWVTKYKEHVRWRDRWRTDTVYVSRTDSVRVPVPVERELTRWERVRLDLGGAAIVAVAVLVLFVIAYIVYKSRRK